MMKKYRKRKYTLKAERLQPGENVYNILEDCSYETTETKCIKLTGIMGEEWVITIEKMEKNYTYIDGSKIAADNIPEGVFEVMTIFGECAPVIWAEQTTGKMKIKTSLGDILTANRAEVSHGNGDYIVCAADEDGLPNPLDRWVVNGVIFGKTYEKV